jgi:hypothetical protein
VAETIGGAVETLWFDAYVHCEDVRDALGRPSEATGGLVGSISHLAQELTLRGWKPATRHFAGMPDFEVSRGGPIIGGDARAFLLAATGRGDPSLLGLDDTVDVIAWRSSQRSPAAG